jgi:PAS domain S-box-containing protein
MNYFAFIPLLAFLINVFTWTYIFAQKRRNPVNTAYLILASTLAAWTLELFLLWIPIEESLLYPLLKITMITGFMVGFFFLNFTYIFLGKTKDKIFYVFLYSAVIASLINIFSNLYVEGYTKYKWGISLEGGMLFVPIAFFVIALPIIYSLSLIYKDMKSSYDSNKKKQLLLLFQGTLASFIIALMSDVFFPYVIGVKNVMRIGISGTMIQSIFVFCAVSKYNFLSMDIKDVAKDLFTNVRDGVVIINEHEYIIQMNRSAKELFGINDFSSNSIKVSSIINDYKFDEDYKNYETTIIKGSDEIFVSLSQATVRQSGLELGKILIIRDITESKKAEKELKGSKTKLEKLAGELAQANASLEQKVAERTKSLLISNEQLQREILERKRAEEELAAEKERLAVTLGSIGDGVITTDTQGHVALLNKAAEHLTGWHQAEAIGQPLAAVFQILDERTRSPQGSPVEEALHTNRVVSRTNHAILIARDRTERIVAESAAPIHDTDGKVIGAVLVFRDVTERRKIEEELIKADKLESIGVLAGGIAHDFNNILTAIIGNISLAKMYASAEDKVYTRLVNAEKAALQAQNLTQQLLTFSKGGSLVRRPASIGDLIRDCIDFSLRGSNVKCEFSLEEDVWPVEIDEGQMSQVINNLIINADQAMPDGGMIEVRAENITVDEGNRERFLPLENGRYVRISVKDHGIGIPEEHIQKIFDPYFTTKQKGSGLGLFTCYSIVKKHEGHLAVESHQGVGTTFYVYIPASQRRVQKAEDKKDVHHSGRGKILIMEDDETIRDVTGEMLSHFGYEVAFARDGNEALDLYAKARDTAAPFDVIIMDLTIPGGMGAKETIAKALQIDPQVKAIVASGYANDPLMTEFAQYGFRDRIVKPYKAGELHEILRRVIADASA